MTDLHGGAESYPESGWDYPEECENCGKHVSPVFGCECDAGEEEARRSE